MKKEPGLDPISNTMYALEEFKPKEMEELYLLNNFLGIKVLMGLKANYRRKARALYQTMVMSAIIGFLTFLAASGIAAFTVSQNWLNNPKLSFIPIMAIICVGGALTYMAFNLLRVNAAKNLKDKKEPISPEFIDRVLRHRQSIHNIFSFAKGNRVGPDNSIPDDADETSMGNTLMSDMIGAKTEHDEDDELHGKGKITYKEYLEEEDGNAVEV